MIQRDCGCVYLQVADVTWQLYDCREGDLFIAEVETPDRISDEPPKPTLVFSILEELGKLVANGYAARDLKRALEKVT